MRLEGKVAIVTGAGQTAGEGMETPWETANVATFLASDEASYITGAVIPMDGGLHTRIG